MSLSETDAIPLPTRAAHDARFGFWAALAAGTLTLLAFAVAIATPPLSGPLCTAGCYSYPYLDVAARYPRDYYWMPPALGATFSFVAFAIAVAARAKPEHALLARFGVALAQMAALTIAGDYFVQLAVIQPSLLAHEADGISLFTQYNPHGLFIALEELGYFLLSTSLACLGASLPGRSGVERVAGRLFVGAWLVCVVAFLWFLTRYGHERAYLLEIAVISIAWVSLVPGAFMMAAVFRREGASGSRPPCPGQRVSHAGRGQFCD